MFYFLTVSYDIGNLYLNEPSHLSGPYSTVEARDKALRENLSERDLESEIVNVTKLKVENGKLVSEGSFLAPILD